MISVLLVENRNVRTFELLVFEWFLIFKWKVCYEYIFKFNNGMELWFMNRDVRVLLFLFKEFRGRKKI